ncbi:hypothetical protein C1H46_029513 [Malus baccata]|uniref:Uncharacterized protein n=1 Tax=Malus baccata TaxID=106549 RepID=A0A540LEM2_MALBA|nr:hypothetical protein C1H46_029513 [Malus baccata]
MLPLKALDQLLSMINGLHLQYLAFAQNPDTESMEEGEMAQQQRPRLPPEIRRIPRELPHRPPGRAGVACQAGRRRRGLRL